VSISQGAAKRGRVHNLCALPSLCVRTMAHSRRISAQRGSDPIPARSMTRVLAEHTKLTLSLGEQYHVL